jgi:hypothetical protein
MSKSFLENSVELEEDLDISEIKSVQVEDNIEEQESEKYKQFIFLKNLQDLIKKDEADL